MGEIPIPGVIIPGILEDLFPEYEVEILEITKLVKTRKDIIFVNLFYMLWERGFTLLTGRVRRWMAFFTTTYIFRKISDLINEHFPPAEAYVFSFQMQSLFDASIPGVPNFVYTDHTHLVNLQYDYFDKRKLPSKALLTLERQIYHKAAFNFTRSSHVTQSLIEDYGCLPEKVACVGVGSNVNTIGSELQNDDYRNKNILFVGVDWERKGGPDLVKAFQTALDTHPDASLTIVGCTPDIDVPNCNIVGRISVGEVQSYYEQASIFCLPTKLEPFGVVFIEAYHYKLPIIATNIGALPDIVTHGKSGYLIESGDSEMLARYLIDLLNDHEKCRQFGEEGYRIVSEKYNWERFAKEIKKHIVAVCRDLSGPT